MERGWGTGTLADNHSNSDHPVGFLFNKSAPLLGRFDHHQQLRRSSANMHSPVILNRGSGRNDDQAASLAAGDENRMVVGEVDFFSTTKSNDIHHRNDSKVVVKKEHSHGDSNVRTDLNVNTGLHLLTTNTGSDQSSVDDGTSSTIEDKRAKNELAVLQVELERMNTENQRLRGMLNQVSSNYSALQMHFVTLMQQQQQQQNSTTEATKQPEIVEGRSDDKTVDNQVGTMVVVPRQFMDLGPSGATPAPIIEEPSHDTSSEERTQSGSAINTGKRIGREETPDSEGWGPNKVPKMNLPKSVEQATEATMRKARVSVRARSEAPMISDGCQWRKYGQKMAKGNPCPRAYYRCTMAVGCPVRKQVQRCADDRAILITTYEGNHNHPLPPAAMAMASTTSAAASMLLSGSMSSADGLMNPNFLARAILPNSSSIATISASAPFPTVTLDLTHTPNPFQRPTNQFQNPNQNAAPRPPPPPQLFGQAGLFNQSKFAGLHDADQSNMHHHGAPPPQFHQPQPQTSFADTLSAATAAITADPNFTAALAAAITSMISGNNNNNIAPTPTSGNNNSTSGSQQKTSSFPGN